MSKSNWLFYVAVRGCLIASLCLSPIAVVQAQGVPHANSSEQSAARIETEPQESWDRISPILLLHFLHRIAGALETEAAKAESPDNTQHDKDDLEAQQQMARWAFWMMVAAFLQALVGGVGIIYIRKTLLQNEAAVKAAIKAVEVAEEAGKLERQIGEAQTRAYISVESATLEIDPKLFYPIVRFKINNSGNSPARQLMIGYRGGYRLDNSARVQPDFAPKGPDSYSWGTDIAGGETREIVTRLTNFPLNQEEITGLSDKAILIFESMVKFEFIDVFDRPISEIQDWCGFVVSTGIQTPFLRTAFVSFRLIEDRAQAKGQ